MIACTCSHGTPIHLPTGRGACVACALAYAERLLDRADAAEMEHPAVAHVLHGLVDGIARKVAGKDYDAFLLLATEAHGDA